MSDMPDEQPESPQEHGISLDALAAAYAQSMGGRTAPEAEPPEEPGETDAAESAAEFPDDSSEETAAGPPPLPEGEADGDDPCPLSPRTILEAMLFVGNRQDEPLTSTRAAELMRGVSPGEVAALVDELNGRYASGGCPYRIVSQGAGYRLSLDNAFSPVRNKFYSRVRQARLSQAAVDVLAIVAYGQPIVAEEVNRLRGTLSGHLLAQLVRRQLLRVERPPGKRRPALYYTTDRFLDLFGLETLKDLPQSEDLEKH
jgi:segregation and condensation protein B